MQRRCVDEPMNGHKNHGQCEFGFCEHSQLDFTKVAQRHESKSCAKYPCKPLRNHFPRAMLEEATKSKKLTAWRLHGKSRIEPPLPFMAISHVWSDGTAAGANWSRGEVNRCLYNYFTGIAERFQCCGIWWDTICIPEDKAARSIAINRMHVNYKDAGLTLVHDCYLREWEWFDAETACFAIIMSPWFSRGWTALELAQSRKVKVIFRDSVIKDLDEYILANRQSIRHRVASASICRYSESTNRYRGTPTSETCINHEKELKVEGATRICDSHGMWKKSLACCLRTGQNSKLNILAAGHLYCWLHLQDL